MDSKTRYLLVFYNIITLAFVLIVALSQRSYQDAWILEDIFMPTVLYILAFSLISIMMDDNRVIALICASFIIILNAIPNLKYQLFYGTFDSVGHFRFTKNLLALGHVPETGFYSPVYSDFPGMHIFISSLSLITGVDVNGSIKFITSIIFGAIPLLAYLVTNRVFDKDIQKYIVVASGLPIVMSYTIAGTTFGMIFFCFFFYTLFRKYLSNGNIRKYTLILITIAFALLFSHAVTTLSVILFSWFMLFLMKFIDFTKKFTKETSSNISSYKTTGIITLLSVSFIAWLMFRADLVFEVFINALQRSFIGEIVEAPIPERFFEIPLLARLEIFALKYTKDAVILVLSLAGFFVLLKFFKHKNVFKNLYMPLICLLSAISSFLAFQFAIGFGAIEYRRFIDYAMLFSPFLAGLFFWYINKRFKTTYGMKWFSEFLTALILFMCISISIIQIFPYQPLVPRANVLSSDLPEGEYIADFRMVNTVYQEKMIRFAEKFSSKNANITSDTVTRWQISGFTNATFSSRHIWYSPLKPEESMKNKQWNLFLLHYGGRSGPLNEKVEYRTKEVIDNLRNTLGNTIYDNGESFIISR